MLTTIQMFDESRYCVDRRSLPTACYGLLLALALLCCLPLQAHAAASSAVVIDSEDRYRLSGSTHLFTGSDLDWQAVAGQALQNGKHNAAAKVFTLDDYELPVWARVDLTVGDIPDKTWLLDTSSAFGGKLTFYAVVDGELRQQTDVNSFESFASRPYNYRNLVFPIDLKANTDVQLLIRFEKSVVPMFFPSLYTEESLIVPDRKETWIQGMVLGLTLGIMLYHFILAGATLDKIYLIYSLYIGTNALFVLVRTGFGYQYVWPDSPWMEVYVGPYIYYLPVFLAVLFTLQFLHLPEISRRFVRFYYGASILLGSLLLLRVGGADIHLGYMSVITLVIFLSFIAAGAHALRKGAVYARFFLIAWTLYCLAIANWLFSISGLPAVFAGQSYELMQFSYVAQVMLLALALAHRIRTMREDKVAAEADNTAKSAFLARMSHEIRTPLSGVLGMSELLSDRLKDKTDIYYNDIIRSSGTSLLTIINDILDYSKFTSGKMEFEKIPFSIQRLAVDSLDIFKVRAAEKNLELIADIDLDLPEFVQGDPTRVKQVMLNFVSNALKFTDAGQIVLSIRPVAEQPEMIKIAVSDSGEGISESEQRKLFDAFSQANSTTSRKHGGTGLGLSICKQLAVLMDGEIGLESNVGEGSTFWFTVHLPKSQEPGAHVNIHDVQLSGYRLLIVEDNYTFANLLQTQAAAWGMQAQIARNGSEALEVLRASHDQGLSFDLISLDLVMPKMDGLEASRNIQLDYRFNKIPRLLLTSATNFPSQHHLQTAGIRKVVEKPTLPAELLNIYKALLANTQLQEQNPAPEEPEHAAIAPLKILVVEDNAVNQIVIEGILKRLNQQPRIVEDGEDAVALLTQEGAAYDLILMDCEMKRMNGVTATRHLRQWESDNGLVATPIVALTAHAVQSQIDACHEAGMNAYLTKPLEIAKLERLLREHAKNRELGAFALKPSALHSAV